MSNVDSGSDTEYLQVHGDIEDHDYQVPKGRGKTIEIYDESRDMPKSTYLIEYYLVDKDTDLMPGPFYVCQEGCSIGDAGQKFARDNPTVNQFCAVDYGKMERFHIERDLINIKTDEEMNDGITF